MTVLRIGSDIILSDMAENRGYVVAWSTLKYTWNEERDYLWPIPVGEMNTNTAMEQNPGY